MIRQLQDAEGRVFQTMFGSSFEATLLTRLAGEWDCDTFLAPIDPADRACVDVCHQAGKAHGGDRLETVLSTLDSCLTAARLR